MSLPDVNDFRQRVESIPIIDKRIAFETVYLVCGRIGEVITEKYPSDKTCNPTGSKLSVSKAIYQPDLKNPQERDTWTFIKMLEGQQVNYAEIAQLKEEVAVFHVATEKRGGLIREIGLPLNPKYDPWVKEAYDYLSQRNEKGFQYTRQEMWSTAKEVFAGLTYKIHPYKRAIIENGKYQYNGKKLIKVQVKEKTKQFTDHGIRHLRTLFNKQFYGLTPEERAGYGGWTLATTTGTSAAQDAYEESPWRLYFPKFLKKIEE
jgi:hypothetical protein